MASKNWQKIKLVKLAELLRQESDEQHPLTTGQICEYMEKYDIPCDRRVVSRDVATLNELGFEIRETKVGKRKGYYVENRGFSTPELKILIDAVQAASFITEEKSKELIGKLASLGGTHRAEIIKSNLVCFNTRKHSNEQIYYNVNALENALQKKKKVIFLYYDLGINHEKIYRRGGHHYVVEPVALVYNEDNYYLVAYSQRDDDTVSASEKNACSQHLAVLSASGACSAPTVVERRRRTSSMSEAHAMANYRVDRMESVEVIDEDISEKAISLRRKVRRYTEQAIKMYGGPMERVTLEFDSKLIGSVYDRFGENVMMKPVGEDRVMATVKVQLSPPFWGWLFQFGNLMRVISPDEVVKEYRVRLEEVLE